MRPQLLKAVLWLILLAGPLPAATEGAQGLPLWGIALDGYPITGERLQEEEARTGLSPELVVFFLQWPAPEETTAAPFPEASLEAIWGRDAVPCLTWEPMYYREGREIMIPAEFIVSGVYDPYILDFARKARAWGKPFMIRFAHEMNVARYHWGTSREAYGPESPDLYIRMFRHVVALFRAAGADNALWVFCPNAESVPNASHEPGAAWNQARNYYPGDRWIDIAGMDGYNWGLSQTREATGWDSRWQSFAEVFTPLYRELRSLAPDKPLLVFETASVGLGGDKRRWFLDALTTAAQWGLGGMVWFQVSKDIDWRIEGRPPLLPEGWSSRRPARGEWIKGLYRGRSPRETKDGDSGGERAGILLR